MSHRTRFYGGKRYSLHGAYDTKRRANKICKNVRGDSWNCRILEKKVPEGNEFYIYKRKK